MSPSFSKTKHVGWGVFVKRMLGFSAVPKQDGSVWATLCAGAEQPERGNHCGESDGLSSCFSYATCMD